MITNLSLASVERQLNPAISGGRSERKKSPNGLLNGDSSKTLLRQSSNGDLPSVLFIQNFAKYLKTGQYSDFTIKLKFSGQEFRVHKVFISHLSEYFQSLLSGSFNESQKNFVELELNSKGDEEIFPAILHYMYTGDITITLENVVHIIIIADRLLMAALKKKAVKYLERMLKPCIAHEPPFIWETPLQELVSKIIREAVDYRFDEGDELLQRAVGLLVRILQMHLEKFRGDIGILPPSLFSLVVREQTQSLIESCLCEYLANSKSMLTKEDFEIIASHLERISLVNAPLFVDLALYFDSKTVKTKALNVIIEEFALFKQDVNLISQLPFDMLVKVLKSDKLQIEHEDELYNFVKFLIEFNEASASSKPRKNSNSREKLDRERFFANGTEDEPSIAKTLGNAFANEHKHNHSDTEESVVSELIRGNFTKWNKKQQRELWETVRWAFCLPETLQTASNIAPEDLVTKGKIYSERLLGGINFVSKTRNHRVRGTMLIGRCTYEEQVESSARQAIKVSDTPRYEYDSESGSEGDERNSNGSNNSPIPSPHLDGSKIDIPSHGVFWWLGSAANSRIYRNPVSSGLIEISCNLGFFDSSNGAALVSKTKQCFYTNSGSGVAISIALNGFEIWPTHYSLTHGDKANQHALTSWSFQGCRNNGTWQVLSEHRKNTQLNSKFARAVFPLKTKDVEIPREGSLFNRFRIVLLEPNSSGQYEISLSDIEIYGRVRGQRRNLLTS